jgi:AcrR family transcriptional regulator
MEEKILLATDNIFSSQGFQKISIRNVANHLGYSPATIYLYYKDKDHLIYSLYCKISEHFILELNTIQADNSIAYLQKLCHHFVHFSNNNPEKYELIFLTKITNTNDTTIGRNTHYQSQFYKLFEKAILNCQLDGFFINHDLDDLYLKIWSLLNGIIALNISKRLFFFNERQLLISNNLINSLLSFVIPVE